MMSGWHARVANSVPWCFGFAKHTLVFHRVQVIVVHQYHIVVNMLGRGPIRMHSIFGLSF